MMHETESTITTAHFYNSQLNMATNPVASESLCPRPLLRAINVSRDDPVSGSVLLQAYSLEVRAGDSVVLTGATGSGKSLLLRSLAMLDPIGAGELHFGGEAVRAHTVPRYRSQVAYVRQRPAMLAETVEQNLQLPYALTINVGRRFDVGAARRLLDTVGQPPGFLAKRARDLSGGEAQIVALIRVLLLDPIVLLLDEPTAALDSGTTLAVEKMLRGWANGGEPKALVMVTHSPEQAERLGRRRLRIAAGRLEPEAPAQRVPESQATIGEAAS